MWKYGKSQNSWSDDIENITSQKILEYWHIIEYTLFNEEDQLQFGINFNECLQWRDQLVFLRIIGRNTLQLKDESRANVAGNCTRNLTVANGNNNAKKVNNKNEDFNECYNPVKQESNSNLINHQNRKILKDKVLSIIVNFICKELSEIKKQNKTGNLSSNFDEFLNIFHSTIYIEKKILDKNFDKTDKTKIYVNYEKTHQKQEEKSKNQNFEVGRSKLGTIFNEKIIVSPVPFVSTKKKSFSTLYKAPISFFKENNVFNNMQSGTSRKKTSLLTKEHIQSWNTPVSPTIWPRNIRLTPIDTTELSISKWRPTEITENLLPYHRRKSLTPISHSIQPNFDKYIYNNFQHLKIEIHGLDSMTHISELKNKFTRDDQHIKSTLKIKNISNETS